MTGAIVTASALLLGLVLRIRANRRRRRRTVAGMLTGRPPCAARVP